MEIGDGRGLMEMDMEIGMDMDMEMGIDFHVFYVGNTHMRFMITWHK